MLIGMALHRSGILTGGRSLAFYGWLAFAGYGIGLLIRGGFSAWEWSTGFEPNPDQMVWRTLLYEAGRLPTTLGLLGLITVLFKSGALGWMANVLQAIALAPTWQHRPSSLIAREEIDGQGQGYAFTRRFGGRAGQGLGPQKQGEGLTVQAGMARAAI